MEGRMQWNFNGNPFQILMVGEPEQLKYYIEFLKKRGLEEKTSENKDYLEGKIFLDSHDDEIFPMKLTIKNAREFEEIAKTQLKFDGIMIYKKDADLTQISVTEPYKGWQNWGEGQVRGLQFIEAVVYPPEYFTWHKGQGEIGVIFSLREFLISLQTEKEDSSAMDDIKNEPI